MNIFLIVQEQKSIFEAKNVLRKIPEGWFRGVGDVGDVFWVLVS